MKFDDVLTGSRSVMVLTVQAVLLRVWNFEELKAPYWRLYWNPEAGSSIRSGRQRYRLEPGQLLLIPPETSFGSILERPTRHLYVHFITQPEWGCCGIEALPVSDEEQRKLEEIFQRGGVGWGIVSVVCEALGRLKSGTWRRPGAVAVSLQRALDAVDERLPDAVSVGELAGIAGMGVNNFIRMFAREMGKTPAKYVLERRIASACILLHHTSKTIESIAEDCGFCDRHHFTRVFVKFRGMAPAKFRQTGSAAGAAL